ncbi:isochorismate synthase [Sporolactobacillus inulinus]|uniref:Isochorismate synthase n=1 Tax=Sporolactobacillus inulinus TaxID=2078 RepID=A0A4Y1Z9R4_9BACL|nr:isochorismate synthase [Sporolactobacillus inulinus]
MVESVRAALNTLCTSLSIPKQPVLMKNKNIQHLYTPVKGRCKSATSLIDLVARLHPTPALGGLPKKMLWLGFVRMKQWTAVFTLLRSVGLMLAITVNLMSVYVLRCFAAMKLYCLPDAAF